MEISLPVSSTLKIEVRINYNKEIFMRKEICINFNWNLWDCSSNYLERLTEPFYKKPPLFISEDKLLIDRINIALYNKVLYVFLTVELYTVSDRYNIEEIYQGKTYTEKSIAKAFTNIEDWLKKRIKDDQGRFCLSDAITLTEDKVINFKFKHNKKIPYYEQVFELFLYMLNILGINKGRILPMPNVYTRTFCFDASGNQILYEEYLAKKFYGERMHK